MKLFAQTDCESPFLTGMGTTDIAAWLPPCFWEHLVFVETFTPTITKASAGLAVCWIYGNSVTQAFS